MKILFCQNVFLYWPSHLHSKSFAMRIIRVYLHLTDAFHRSAEICRRKCVLQHAVRKTINFCIQTQMGNYSLVISFTHSFSGLRHICPFFRVALCKKRKKRKKKVCWALSGHQSHIFNLPPPCIQTCALHWSLLCHTHMISMFLHCAPAGIFCTVCISLGLIGFPEYILTHWQRSCSLAEIT